VIFGNGQVWGGYDGYSGYYFGWHGDGWNEISIYAFLLLLYYMKIFENYMLHSQFELNCT